LFRATLIALAVAGLLLVTVVMPAEYGVDVTGAGRLFGLTEMGEIKQQLAREAATAEAATAEAAERAAAEIAAAEPPAAALQSPAEQAGSTRTAGVTDSASTNALAAVRADTVDVGLAPNEGKEVKLVMRKGQAAMFNWRAEGGAVNFDQHGDSTGAPNSYIGYDKGTRVEADSGTLVAAMDGGHGWFWRNRSGRNVVVRLIVSGEYAEIKRYF
jgi:hypothetical protein